MRKRIVLVLILLLTVVCVPVFAKPKTDNGFIVEDEVNLKKQFNTSTFVVGNNVEMSSGVDGLNFVAGNNITLSSSQDHLFTAGNMITLDGVSTKDAFVAGSTITVKDSYIRDLYAAASTVRIDSPIGRNVYVGGDKVIINSEIGGDVKIAAEQIIIEKEATILGTLLYPKDATIEIAESAEVAEKKIYEGNSNTEVEVTTADLITEFCTSVIGLVIVAFILLAIHKPLFKFLRKEKQEAANVAKTMAIGFGVLVGLPIAAIIALITVVGIPLSLISLVFYGVAIYLSIIPTAFFVSKWIMKDKKVNEFLLLGCALLALRILKLLPIVGGLISFASLILGLGLFTNFVIASAKEAKK